MEAIIEPADELVRALGPRLRQLRRARGLTLVQLAASAGLSHPFLSKLERGLATPSMASLTQLARALGTSQLELLAGGAPRPSPVAEVVRAGCGAAGPYGLGMARMLAAGRGFQPMECEGDNTDPGEFYQHAEDEFLYVIGGSVTVDLGEHGEPTLVAGDSLFLGGGVPHRWRTASAERYRLLLVKERPEG